MKYLINYVLSKMDSTELRERLENIVRKIKKDLKKSSNNLDKSLTETSYSTFQTKDIFICPTCNKNNNVYWNNSYTLSHPSLKPLYCRSCRFYGMVNHCLIYNLLILYPIYSKMFLNIYLVKIKNGR